VNPLPKLRSADLCRGGVFHQLKSGTHSDAAQPRLNITQTKQPRSVQSRIGNLSIGNLDQIRSGAVIVRQAALKSD